MFCREGVAIAWILLAACGESPVESTSGGGAGEGTMSLPVPVFLEADRHLTFALMSDGSTRCWGLDQTGWCSQFSPRVETPMQAALPPLKALRTSYPMWIGIAPDDRVVMGGSESYTEYGDGPGHGSGLHAPPFVGVVAVTARSGLAEILLADGSLWWAGHIGVAPSEWQDGVEEWTPVTWGRFRALSDRGTSCVVDLDDRAWCRGYGSNLGAGRHRDSAEFVRVDLPERVADLTGSFGYSCAVTRSGSVWCWGSGWYGPVPVNVDGVSEMARVRAGDGGVCAWREDGWDVQCWGNGARRFLQEEDGYIGPTSVSLPGPVQDIAIGSSHACYLLRDSTLWCADSGYYAFDPEAPGRCIPTDGLAEIDLYREPCLYF